MSRWERYTGPRERTFSRWHRTLPDRCTAIDLDFLEYCRRCRKPVMLIEIARDVGQAYKPTLVLRELSKLSGVPAFLILYKIDVENEMIGDCRVARIWPDPTSMHPLTRDKVRGLIVRMHDEHVCPARSIVC